MLANIRRVYYDKHLGDKLIELGFNGYTIPTSIEKDIATYTALSERNRDTFDVLELPYGAYSQDFAESNGYRVNVLTKELEFSYPDPNEPEAPPVFVKPLTEEIQELKEKQMATDRLINENTVFNQDLLEVLLEMGVL